MYLHGPPHLKHILGRWTRIRIIFSVSTGGCGWVRKLTWHRDTPNTPANALWLSSPPEEGTLNRWCRSPRTANRWARQVRQLGR